MPAAQRRLAGEPKARPGLLLLAGEPKARPGLLPGLLLSSRVLSSVLFANLPFLSWSFQDILAHPPQGASTVFLFYTVFLFFLI